MAKSEARGAYKVVLIEKCVVEKYSFYTLYFIGKNSSDKIDEISICRQKILPGKIFSQYVNTVRQISDKIDKILHGDETFLSDKVFMNIYSHSRHAKSEFESFPLCA